MNLRICVVLAAWLALCLQSGARLQASPPIQLSDSITIQYLGLDVDRIIPCSPEQLRKEGRHLEVRGIQCRLLNNLLSSATPSSYVEPTDVRMAILQPRKETLFFGTDGEITQGKKSWQLGPRAFLRVFLVMQDIQKIADAKGVVEP